MSDVEVKRVATVSGRETAFQAESVSAGYNPARPIISDLSFTVARGEIAALVGPSGVGKTTLLRTLSGLLPVLQGQVVLEGVPVVGPPRELTMVFQDYSRSLLPWMTVRKNVELVLEAAKVDKKARRARADRALAAVGLADHADKFPWQMSGGMQQRSAIARALAYEPHVLLMDEPFASVDAITRNELEDLVLSVQQEFGVTVMLVTHDIDEAIYMSDRIFVLNGTPATIQEIVEVPLSRPRNQVDTKAEPLFAELRGTVYRLVHRN
ncbi:ABC transporter ATP-binding protein [soil metagenome]